MEWAPKDNYDNDPDRKPSPSKKKTLDALNSDVEEEVKRI